VPDLPIVPADSTQAARVLSVFDTEAKIVRAILDLAPVEGRRVVLLGRAPRLAARMRAAGAAAVSIVNPVAAAGAGPSFASTRLPDHAADVVIATWVGFDGVRDAAELAEAERILAPGSGRLLLLKDYGRDDLTAVRGPERTAHLVARSRRDGWLLRSGFRLHVIHAWWRFADLDEAGEVLRAALGTAGEPLVAGLRRPAVAHNVSIYHRTVGES
jgi:hypothetical protein